MALRDLPSSAWSFAKQVVDAFVQDDCLTMAAALAYYTVFSLAPLVVIVLIVAGMVVSPEAASRAVNDELQGLIGHDGAQQVSIMVQHVQAEQSRSQVARIVGGAVALFGATGVMVQLQSALNRAWQVVPDPRAGGLWRFVFKRLLSFAMILGIAFLLLVSLVLTALLTAVANQVTTLVPIGSTFTLQVVNFTVSLVVITLLFAAIYKFMPDARIRWRDVAVGALISALLFSIGKMLIGVYLGNSNVGSAYGAASSLALLLVWVYYSSIIVLLGAELTQVWAHRYGRGLEPDRGARFAPKRDCPDVPTGHPA